MRILEELRRRYAAATQGRWEAFEHGMDLYVQPTEGAEYVCEFGSAGDPRIVADAAHIAAAHNAHEALLRVAEEAAAWIAMWDDPNSPARWQDEAEQRERALRAALADLEQVQL